MEVTVAVITDMHQGSTDRATAVKDVEFPERKISLGRPLVRHPVALRVGVASLVRRSRTGGYAEKPRVPSPLSDRWNITRDFSGQRRFPWPGKQSILGRLSWSAIAEHEPPLAEPRDRR